MKKLLSIISSVGLVASSTTIVVACTNQDSEKADLNQLELSLHTNLTIEQLILNIQETVNEMAKDDVYIGFDYSVMVKESSEPDAKRISTGSLKLGNIVIIEAAKESSLVRGSKKITVETLDLNYFSTIDFNVFADETVSIATENIANLISVNSWVDNVPYLGMDYTLVFKDGLTNETIEHKNDPILKKGDYVIVQASSQSYLLSGNVRIDVVDQWYNLEDFTFNLYEDMSVSQMDNEIYSTLSEKDYKNDFSINDYTISYYKDSIYDEQLPSDSDILNGYIIYIQAKKDNLNLRGKVKINVQKSRIVSDIFKDNIPSVANGSSQSDASTILLQSFKNWNSSITENDFNLYFYTDYSESELISNFWQTELEVGNYIKVEANYDSKLLKGNFSFPVKLILDSSWWEKSIFEGTGLSQSEASSNIRDWASEKIFNAGVSSYSLNVVFSTYNNETEEYDAISKSDLVVRGVYFKFYAEDANNKVWIETSNWTLYFSN